MFNKKLENIIDALDDVIEISKSESILIINADLQERIFNKGQDITNAQIGEYSEKYKVFKQSLGRQTNYVDLTLTTDLNKSIQTDKTSIYFKNNYGQTTSKKNEQRFGKRIFAPSKDEREVFINTLSENLSQLYAS